MQLVRPTSTGGSQSATRLAYALVAVFMFVLLFAFSNRSGHSRAEAARTPLQRMQLEQLSLDIDWLVSAHSHQTALAATGRFLDDYDVAQLDRATSDALVSSATAAARRLCDECVGLIEANRERSGEPSFWLERLSRIGPT